jgi:hypothetical protein
MGNYFICKGSILKLYKSLMKAAKALSAKASSLQPQAAKDYAEAMVRWNSWDFAKAECYHPRHCYDEINSLSKEAEELRDKANKLKAWADTFTWVDTPKGERAYCSKKQSDFMFRITFEYKELIKLYCPK